MRRHLQQGVGELVAGWLLAVAATAVYLLTLEPSVSFWDCGEFIATSAKLQVGHPPGAPTYQLIAHMFSWLAGGNAQAVAACCNALSAVVGGLTAMFMYWSLLLLMRMGRGGRPLSAAAHVGAVVGTLCYVFCDTAWFSAVESEVYSLSMLFSASVVWLMLRWHADRSAQAQRYLLLIALLLGLSVGVHQLTLLTTPLLLLVFVFKMLSLKAEQGATLASLLRPRLKMLLPLALFFAIGLSTYLIIPIRANAHPPINEGCPATAEAFRRYVNREQYEQAPLYPRMWRQHEHDAEYAAVWSGHRDGLAGNLCYYASYQLTYMYVRYLMWNFSGRYNDRQGYGSPQNGQFITGLPFIDRALVGTGARVPDSLPSRGHNVYYMLPLLLGLMGACALWERGRKPFWAVATLFLMGGVVLSVYLNHPAYEPRERDYAYVLSFYAFALWIAFGAEWAVERVAAWMKARPKGARFAAKAAASVLVMCVPLLMACQNWDDHDRSHRLLAHDTALNMLNSCDEGAVLFTYGDNDTFPLWCLRHVDGERTDMRVENIGLMGSWQAFMTLLDESMAAGRPVYLTHYAAKQYRRMFEGCLRLEGNAYRLMPEPCDSVSTQASLRHLAGMGWSSLDGVYVDEVSCRFLQQYWRDMLLIARTLVAEGRADQAVGVLDKTLLEIPLRHLEDLALAYDVAKAYREAGAHEQYRRLRQEVSQRLESQLDYYSTMPRRRQEAMPYTLGPKYALRQELQVDGNN